MFQYNPQEAVAHLRQADAHLNHLIDLVGDFTLEIAPISSPYEALARSIVYQQLSVKSAGTIYGRFRGLYSANAHPTPQEVLNTPFETLRSVGLSNNKTKAILDLAQKTADGHLPDLMQIQQMPDDDVKSALCAVRGIGPWTVEMMLIFSLGRADVMPSTDLGVQKGCQKTFGLAELPTPKALMEMSEPWKPFRSVAAWYFWRSLELGEIPPQRYQIP